MKRAIIFILILCLVLTGCKQPAPAEEPVEEPSAEPETPVSEPAAAEPVTEEPSVVETENVTGVVEVSGNTVEITENFKFDPEVLTIKTGTTMTWQNNARSYLRLAVRSIPYDTSKSAKLERFGPGETTQHTFNDTGKYLISFTFGSSTAKSTIIVE